MYMCSYTYLSLRKLVKIKIDITMWDLRMLILENWDILASLDKLDLYICA